LIRLITIIFLSNKIDWSVHSYHHLKASGPKITGDLSGGLPEKRAMISALGEMASKKSDDFYFKMLLKRPFRQTAGCNSNYFRPPAFRLQ